MTKKEFINLFNIYDDDSEISFYDEDDEVSLEPRALTQYLEDDSLTIILNRIV